MTISATALLLAVLHVGLAPSATTPPKELRETIANFTREAVTDSPAASISVAVFARGNMVLEGAVGRSNLELGTPSSTVS